MPVTRRAFFRKGAMSAMGITGAATLATEQPGDAAEDGNWTFNDVDASIAAELQQQLPERLFDIHAHLYRNSDLGQPCPELPGAGPDRTDVDAWRLYQGKITGAQRLNGGLFFPYPVKNGDVDAGNDFLLEQVSRAEMARGLIVVTPDMDRAKAESYFQNPRIIGFKPYHIFAPREQTFNAALEEYIPEWAWEMAHAREGIIVLHLVRQAALSDPENHRSIRTLCTKYPKANLVLAHAGRGFHAPNTIRALPALKDLDNLYFDTSAVCEPDTLMAIVKTFGPQRLLWGSDFPVSQQRGKCVTVGDAFSWICPRRIDVYPDAPVCNPTLVGLESLRAALLMASLLDLSKQDREDLFYNNALRLLRMQDA
ncbi:MAG: Amidohydrolase [Candidatus Hydrogenedentes bacterium ADurb.Bin179]|nr:MAG: Amidohydrolase [Candidatus Hydrogenedentes bacterium ADurb.Bin179]